MNLLILGGGVFLGQALLQAALERGDAVTVFNRGQSRTWWPPGVKWVVGDRREDLHLLMNHRWDAVIDTCGYLPQDVEASCAALFDACDRYLFVSSVSAYASFAQAPITETDPLSSAVGVDRDTVTPATYGPLKAECERTVSRILGARALVVRPGLLVGPNDPTGRFSYWPWRIAGGGRVLAPGSALRSIQFIDVRDLAAWMLRLVQSGASGAFNATGPNDGTTFMELLETCRWISGQDVEIEWVDDQFLLSEGVAPWSELPLWIPTDDERTRGFYAVDTTRARMTGLRTRPAAVTVSDILEAGLPAPDDKRRHGKLTRERERNLLAVWSSRKQGMTVA
jgi:2'-hydroxyisoflavone reductase